MPQKTDTLNYFIINEAWSVMDDDQKEHFKRTVAALLSAYVLPDTVAMVIIAQQPDTQPAPQVTDMISMNATDLTIIHMLNHAQQEFGTIVMEDAPPRALFS